MKKYLAFLGAAVFCPCHLPVWAALLGGTALGAFLAQNLIWLFGVLTLGFIFFLSYGLRLWFKERRS